MLTYLIFLLFNCRFVCGIFDLVRRVFNEVKFYKFYKHKSNYNLCIIAIFKYTLHMTVHFYFFILILSFFFTIQKVKLLLISRFLNLGFDKTISHIFAVIYS